MGTFLRKRIKPLAGLLAALMVINMFTPFANKMARAAGSDATGKADMGKLITSVQISDKDINYNPYNNDQIIGDNNQPKRFTMWLNFELPASNTADDQFNGTKNPYLTFDLNEIIARDSNGNTNGKPLIDLSSFDQNALKGDIDIPNTNFKAPYSIDNNPSSSTYGLLTIDLRDCFNADGSPKTGTDGGSVYGRTGNFKFSCSLDSSAFGNNSGNYTLSFLTLANPSGGTPTFNTPNKTNIDLGLNTTKTSSSVGDDGKVTYTIKVENTYPSPTGKFVLTDSFPSGLEAIEATDITVTGTGVSVKKTADGKFTFTVDNLAANSSFTITYSSTVKDSYYTANGMTLTNSVTGNVPGDDRKLDLKTEPNMQDTVSATPQNSNVSLISKSHGEFNKSTNSVTWTINVNSGSLRGNISGMHVNDVLTGVEATLDGKITILDKDAGTSVEVDSLDALNSYTFPDLSSDNSKRNTHNYVITYTTTVDEEKLTGDKDLSVDNTAKLVDSEGKDYGNPANSGVGVYKAPATPTPEPVVDKSAVDNAVVDLESETVTANWRVVVHIDEDLSKYQMVYADPNNPGQGISIKEAPGNDQVIDWENASIYYIDDDNNKVAITAYTRNQNDIKITDEELLHKIEGHDVVLEYTTTYSIKDYNYNNNVTLENTAYVDYAWTPAGNDKETVNVTIGSKPTPSAPYVAKKADSEMNVADHTIAWTVYINACDQNTPLTPAQWTAIKLTDHLNGMEFLGSKSGGESNKDAVLVNIGGGREYWVPVVKTADGFTADFSKASAVNQGWNPPFDWGSINGGQITVKYITKVPDSMLPTGEFKNGNFVYSKTYENGIEFEGITDDPDHPIKDSATGESTVTKDALDKKYVNMDEKGVLTYSITINPFGKNFVTGEKADKNTIKVIDTLPDCLDYVKGTMKVVNLNTGKPLEVDYVADDIVDANHYEFRIEGNDIILFVPDDQPLQVTYGTRSNLPNDTPISIENTVTIPNPYFSEDISDSTNNNTKVANSSGSLSSALFIEKVPSNRPDVYLGGAQFTITEYLASGEATKVVYNAESLPDRAIQSSDLKVATGSAKPFDANNKEITNANLYIQPDRVYKIVETKAPGGYKLDSTEYWITTLREVKADTVKANFPNVLIMGEGCTLRVANTAIDNNTEPNKEPTDTPSPTPIVIKVSKVETGAGEELPGAEIELYDVTTGEKVDSWTSTDAAHETDVVKAGHTYKLVETVAPDGYTIATETYFKITDDGKVTTEGLGDGQDAAEIKDGIILVNDDKTDVKVSKIADDTNAPLEGAKFVIRDAETQKIVLPEWTSATTAEDIKGILKVETPYILEETDAPKGYTKADSITFTIEKDGTVKVDGEAVANNTIVVTDAKIKPTISVSKVDAGAGTELEGAHIELYDVTTGEKVDEWNSTKDAHVSDKVETGKTYKLVETVAPEGYTIATETYFKITDDGKVTTDGLADDQKAAKVTDGVILVEDDMTSVKVGKADGEKSTTLLAGATFEIYDSEGTKKVEWDTTASIHTITGVLKINEVYTLKEVKAPDGYVLADDIQFKLDDAGNIVAIDANHPITVVDGALLMADTKTDVKVSKVDKDTGVALSGAKFVIKDAETQAVVVEEFTSTATAATTILGKLSVGKTYILEETEAPDKYDTVDPITFTLKDDGTVVVDGSEVADKTIVVADKKITVKPTISVSKVDAGAGTELEGAHIQIIDVETGKVVDEWNSTKDAHVSDKVEAGKTYTLKETVAPDGYTITTETTFTLDADGKIDKSKTTTKVSDDGVLLVEDDMTDVKVSKVDKDTGAALSGAKFVIKDAETQAVVVEEFTSTATAATTILGKLSVGKTYILEETEAPDKYDTADSITFTLEKDGTVKVNGAAVANNTIVVEDAKLAPTPVTVLVKKVDSETGDGLAEAKFVIKDAETQAVVVDEWTSTTSADEIAGKLYAGKTYILEETEAPKGYDKSASVTFKINDDGKVVIDDKVVDENTIVVADTKIAPTPVTVLVKKVDSEDTSKVLDGAEFVITDSEGTEIATWTSTTSADEIADKLYAGKTYTLTEKKAPAGYKVADPITFSINEEGKVVIDGAEVADNTIVVKDAKLAPTPVTVLVKKVDSEDTTKVLDGAEFVITDSEGTEVATWTSTTSADEIADKLYAGKTYTLTEKNAPKGYEKAAPITFSINEDGKVVIDGTEVADNTIVVEDAKLAPTPVTVLVKKVDAETGDGLAEAKFVIRDAETQEIVVPEWTSTTDANEIANKLYAGKTYILEETEAPKGYDKAASVTFKINDDGKVVIDDKVVDDNTIVVADTKLAPTPVTVLVKKVDAEDTTKVLDGAEFVITDSE
ncbi:MAG: hypothetical protein MJ108_08385, partial [Saccharofermentans sp.]|nr:hypothetical protein [Saccharofermentans sp.]